jgi:hypothetical protein
MTGGEEARSAEVSGFVAEGHTQRQARRRRNVVLALALAGFVVLIFVVTLARLQGDVLNRPF